MRKEGESGVFLPLSIGLIPKLVFQETVEVLGFSWTTVRFQRRYVLFLALVGHNALLVCRITGKIIIPVVRYGFSS